MSYLRIGNSGIAWFFALKMPFKFAVVALMADTLSLIDVASSGDSLAPMTDSMLRIVADMLWTTIIIFAGLMKVAPDVDPAQ
mmetsp:Transcript_15006/g.20371  ORF Transcript_15006/g.20371 Transcript_15006/m.20371 type:complete len:82 (+) Transcript_15006:21-266(+)